MSTNPPAVPADELPAAPAPAATLNPMAELYNALANAQGEFSDIKRNREGQKGNRTFMYADLDELIRATRPALRNNGLGVMQPLQSDERGDVLITKLVHKSGAVETSSMAVPTNYAALQDYGAAITNLRRYAYQAILCISAGDDVDEGDDLGADDTAPSKPAGVAMPKRKADAQQAQPATAAPTAGPAAAPAQQAGELDTTPCTTGEIAYLSKKVKAKGWTMSTACEQAGLAPLEDEKALTKGYFNAIKAVV